MINVLDHSHPFDRFFEEISRIPHGSGNEKAISDYLVEFAERNHLWWHRDDVYNVIIKKPASKGYENAPTVVLQAHTDMVCEKVDGSTHDFLKDPLKLILNGNILTADGTTLGADDAVGVAYMMGILEQNEVPHPPLECVFTSSEETGMHGVRKLHFDLLEGRRIINLDNAGETETGLNGAGGIRALLTCPASRQAQSGTCFQLTVDGLNGGHTGCDNNVEKGNAIVIAAQLIYELIAQDIPFQIIAMQGGTVPNAFPRQCSVTFCCGAEYASKAEALLTEKCEEMAEMYRPSEQDISCRLETAVCGDGALTVEQSQSVIRLLYSLPNGVSHKSLEFEDFISASSNLGVIRTEPDSVQISMSLRGETEFRLDELYRKVQIMAELLHISVSITDRYPCWRHNPVSKMREVADQVMRARLGQPLRCVPVHAGVELSFFAQAFPEIDALGIGPIAGCPHSPSEWLDMDSAHRLYDVLLHILEALKD